MFSKFFDPTQPNPRESEKSRPNPTQPNPRVNPTHEHLQRYTDDQIVFGIGMRIDR